MKGVFLFSLFFLVSFCQPAHSQQPDEQGRLVESTLFTEFVIKGKEIPLFSIPDRMKFHKIPGLSIAFIDGDEIKWVKCYGVKQRGGSEPVTPGTMFQVGSVSKPVTAALLLTLVRQGKVDLDRDVNKYLEGWHIPENRFTRQEKVTLRRLLSHSAGITVHGFNGYANAEVLPTLAQMLGGNAPAKNAPIVVDTTPGSIWRYSGGGYMIAQKILEDVSGKSLSVYAKEKIFSRLFMNYSFFEQPLLTVPSTMAATGHSVFGKAFDNNFLQPELAAGGLWSNPGDLAKFIIEIIKESKGQSDLILNQQLASQMLTRQIKNWTLGFSLNGPLLFHGGSCEGFRTVIAYHQLKSKIEIQIIKAI